MGTGIDALTNYSLRLAGVVDEEDKSEETLEKERIEKELFLKRKRKGFGTILFDEARDCPICLDQFCDKDEVI